MVPVLDKSKEPLMPCSEKRARRLMEKGEAKAYWYQGIFCIILQKEPSAQNFQDVGVGVDPGSKREGYTVTTEKKVVLNLLTDTPCQVKKAVKNRRELRRCRRYRKTPYRKCRYNRALGGIPPSTKARWGAKLRVLRGLKKILPITDINVEDIKAKTLKGKRRWNTSFSPLEVGKKWFYQELRNDGFKVFLTQGFETKEHRDYRGFKKTGNKLKPVWSAHCVDSHSLCERIYGSDIEPFYGMYFLSFFNFSRRQIHVQNFAEGGVRKLYGGTLSLGLTRGTLVHHPKFGKSFVGGTSKSLISLHSVETGRRLTQGAKKKDLKILSRSKWRTAFLPALKDGVSSRKTR